jgi:hypothetical protein
MSTLPDPVLHPNSQIRIFRARLRLHIVAYPRKLYSTQLELIRDSDGAIIQSEYFAAGFFYEEGFKHSVAATDLTFNPNFFAADLAVDFIKLKFSALFDVDRDSPEPIPRPLADQQLIAEAYSQYSYIAEDAKFESMQWVSTGNYLLGLKEDGTIWKSIAPTADPLVFTQVYPT